MKTDLTGPADIEKVVALFYEKVQADDLIGFFFTEVIPVDWSRHVQLMCAFWENVLFYTGDYEGDPLTTHRRLNRLQPTTPAHFSRWIQLFAQSVDELYEGPNAAKMKAHARGIAAVMQQQVGRSPGE